MKTIIVAILHENQLIKDKLSKLIVKYCPDLEVNTSLNSFSDLNDTSHSSLPKIIFVNPYKSSLEKLKLRKELLKNTAIILLLERDQYWDFPLNYFHPAGYLYKPINEELLIITIENIKNLLSLKQLAQTVSNPTKIGIPSTDGLDFILVNDIIRCESLGNCTQIILTHHKKNIVSSYNIGEFKKLLLPYGFFCPHKSHLINLLHIDKYKREGIIFMKESKQALIPVAQTKRVQFLNLITRL